MQQLPEVTKSGLEPRRAGRGTRARAAAAGSSFELALAERVVDAALTVTRLLRREVRRRQPAGLSISQVRALSLLSRADGVSLADLAGYVGLGPPAASRLVDELVRRELVVRQAAVGDRRRLALRLLPAGAKALQLAVDSARALLLERLAAMPAEEQARLYASMESLLAALARPVETPRDGLLEVPASAPSAQRRPTHARERSGRQTRETSTHA